VEDFELVLFAERGSSKLALVSLLALDRDMPASLAIPLIAHGLRRAAGADGA
jgi:hypothetical protein